MTLDLACLAVVVLAAIAGAFVGGLRQVAHLAAVLGGWMGARIAVPVLAPVLQGRVPAFAAHPIAAVVAFVACTAVATVVVRIALALTPLRRLPGGRLDRALGALAGGLHAAVVVWVALSALAIWNRPVHMGSFVADPAGSELAGFAREHNALGAGLAALRGSATAAPSAASSR